jgi:hypothetical protein
MCWDFVRAIFNFHHVSLASGREVFSSCGADPSKAKKRLRLPTPVSRMPNAHFHKPTPGGGGGGRRVGGGGRGRRGNGAAPGGAGEPALSSLRNRSASVLKTNFLFLGGPSLQAAPPLIDRPAAPLLRAAHLLLAAPLLLVAPVLPSAGGRSRAIPPVRHPLLPDRHHSLLYTDSRCGGAAPTTGSVG